MQLFNNVVKRCSSLLVSHHPSMLLFFFKPVSPLLQCGFCIIKQRIFLQNEKQERQKNLFSWVPIFFFPGQHWLPLSLMCHWPDLSHINNSRPIAVEAECVKQTGWDQSWFIKYHWGQVCFTWDQVIVLTNHKSGSDCRNEVGLAAGEARK